MMLCNRASWRERLFVFLLLVLTLEYETFLISDFLTDRLIKIGSLALLLFCFTTYRPTYEAAAVLRLFGIFFTTLLLSTLYNFSVEGVATFYSLFHLEPVGKHRFYVCTNLSCMLRGANEIVDRLKQSIGVTQPNQVSPDLLFSYEEVECLGACEFAPMMRLDHKYHYDLTPETINDVVAQLRKTGLLPTRGEVAPPHSSGGGPQGRRGSAGGEIQAPKKPRATRKKKADG